MKKMKLIFWPVILLLSASQLFADTLVLKSAKQVKGRIIERTDKYVKIDLDGMVLTFFNEEIQSIKEEQNEPSAEKPIIESSDTPERFIIYDDKELNYIPSGYMGDDKAIEYQPDHSDNPHQGKYCQKWIYYGKSSQGNGWAGVYWQEPANNWGEIYGGFNLSKFTKLTFWARGENGTEILNFKVGGITGRYPDSAQVELPNVGLTKEWKKYTINLEGKDLSRIIGGFCWSASKQSNPFGCIFYLDDIVYE